MTDKISIILPLFNASEFIDETLQSVLGQTYVYWELIIVDDASTDSSVATVRKYVEKDERIKLLQHRKNSGAAKARNTGIKNAEGRYIAFIDSDDLWLPDKLDLQLKFMDKQGLSLTYTSQIMIDENGDEKGRFIVKDKITYQSMLRTCSIGCNTAIYDTVKLGKCYFPLQRGHEDYVLWLKIMKQIGVTKGIVKPLAKYRVVSGSVSSNKIQAAKRQWKVYREVENLNLIQSCYYFSHYAVNAIFKFGLKRWWL